MSSSQHLSDEAVAAFADGVLPGRARERARRHVGDCAECAQAVRTQREAAFALRAAPAPDLPGGLLERLRGLPEHTPITVLPTVVAPDGSTMLSTFAPAAAFVEPASGPRTTHRTRLAVSAAALAMAAGAVTAGVVTHGSSGAAPSPAQHTRVQPGEQPPPAHPVRAFRAP